MVQTDRSDLSHQTDPADFLLATASVDSRRVAKLCSLITSNLNLRLSNLNDHSTPTAEVISIGDEMTSGARLDTNAQWLSRRLGELGIEVQFHSTVGDTLAHNVDVFKTAASRADFVVATGGLGPTRDDLTRQALAEASGQTLEVRQSALDHIASLFAARNYEMPERNQVQALFPAGSLEVFNPQGTAPGVDITIGTQRPCRIFALPGVPAEMKQMFDETVAPRILDSSGRRSHIEHSVMKFFGVGESEMERRLGPMIARDRSPRVGITVSSATISLRISAIADSQQQCQKMIAETRTEIMERVGELHFGDGEDCEQYHAVEKSIGDRGGRLTTVEFGRGAPLANWFASIGKTKAYGGGLSFGDHSEMTSMFGGNAETVCGDLHRQNCDRAKNSEQGSPEPWMLVVDSYPSLNSPESKPLPASKIKFSVHTPDGTVYSTTKELGGHPSIVHPRIGKAALHWIRKVLAGNHSEPAKS